MHGVIPRVVLSFFLLLAAAGCDDAGSRIVGKWQAEGAMPVVWEFSKSGAVTTSSGPGNYSFGSSKRLKIQTQFATFIYEVEFAGDTMKWRDPNGILTELKRVP